MTSSANRASSRLLGVPSLVRSAPIVASAAAMAGLSALAGCTVGGDGVGDGGVGSGNDGAPWMGPDVGPVDASFAACESVSVDARNVVQPADIIWVIDNSPSMREEADLVQNEINDFVTAIGSSGADYRVVMISSSAFVQVPDPLGSDSERFRFINDDVQSTVPMRRALARANDYTSFLRDGSMVHFVFVTDDESSLGAPEFLSEIRSILSSIPDSMGHDLRVHAIVSPPGSERMVDLGPFGIVTLPGCQGMHGSGDANGQQYFTAAAMTMGLQLDICTADWGPLFDDLSTTIGVARPLPCSYRIPESTPERPFDRSLVNVIRTSGSGEALLLPYVGDEGVSNCPSDGRGWYYDRPDAPRQVRLCPAICEADDVDPDARVDIQLGCETQVI